MPDASSPAGETGEDVLQLGWEARDLRSLRAAVAEEAPMRSPSRVGTGPGPLVSEVTAALGEMPDLQYLCEAQLDTDTPAQGDALAGRHLTRRATLSGHHLGAGRLGAPTGKRLSVRVMADLWQSGGQIRDAWWILDRGAALTALGLEPKTWAADMVAAQGGTERCPLPLTPDTDPEGPYLGRGDTTGAAGDLAGLMKEAMAGNFGALRPGRDAACELVLPGGRSGIGHGDAEAFWIGLRAALPSAAFRVEHATAVETPGWPLRVAVRWTLYGKHDGPGMFGPATGAYVFVLGMTQTEVTPGGVRREWTLIDEPAVWTQILLTTG